MLLVNVPVPLPSTVLEFAIVGPEAVFQQTPRAVIEAPPSAVIVPPLVAVLLVTAVTEVVLPTTGTVVTGVGGGVGDGLDLLQPAKDNIAVIAIRVKLIFIKEI
jgi:hypothetical protein